MNVTLQIPTSPQQEVPVNNQMGSSQNRSSGVQPKSVGKSSLKVMETFLQKITSVPPTPRRKEIVSSLASEFQKLLVTPLQKHADGMQGVYMCDKVIIKSLDRMGREEESLAFDLFGFYCDRVLPSVPLSDLQDKTLDASERERLSVDKLSVDELHAMKKNLQPGFTEADLQKLLTNKKNSKIIAMQCLDSLSASDKESYRAFQRCKWSYFFHGDIMQVMQVSFILLQKQYLLSPESVAQSLLKADYEKLEKFLKLPWLFKSDEVLLHDLKPESSLVAKRKVPGLLQLWEIIEYDDMQKILFDELEPACEVAFLLTGLFQFLDYHSKNIGFELAATLQTSPYVGYQYTLDDQTTLTLHDLSRRIFTKTIHPQAHNVTIVNPKITSKYIMV